MAIDRGTAEDYGFGVGDRTTVLLADGTQPEVEIVGIFTFGEANNLLGARLTAFDVDVAGEVFGAGDQFDSIDALAAPIGGPGGAGDPDPGGAPRGGGGGHRHPGG